MSEFRPEWVIGFADYFAPSRRRIRRPDQEKLELLARAQQNREERLKLSLVEMVERREKRERQLQAIVERMMGKGKPESEPTPEKGPEKHCETLEKVLELLRSKASIVGGKE